VIQKIRQNNSINLLNFEKSNQACCQEKNSASNNINNTLACMNIPQYVYKANLGIKDISFGRNLDETLETLGNITYGMNYLLNPDYKIHVVRGEKNFKILNFYQKKEDVIDKFKHKEIAYGICNDLSAAYTDFLTNEHSDKIFVIVYDETSMRYAVVHYYIAAFDKNEKNIKIFESLNNKNEPVIMKDLPQEKKDEFNKLFKDKDTILIDPSTYQFGGSNKDEFSEYIQDKLISLNMANLKAKEMGRGLIFSYGRPLMLGSLDDFLNKEERQNLKQILSNTKNNVDLTNLFTNEVKSKPKFPEHKEGKDLAILVSFDKNPGSKVKIYVSKYGDMKVHRADEIRDCLVKGSNFDKLLQKFDEGE